MEARKRYTLHIEFDEFSGAMIAPTHFDLESLSKEERLSFYGSFLNFVHEELDMFSANRTELESKLLDLYLDHIEQ